MLVVNIGMHKNLVADELVCGGVRERLGQADSCQCLCRQGVQVIILKSVSM